MIKAKRSPGNRLKLFFLLFVVIFLAGFGLGMLAINVLVVSAPQPLFMDSTASDSGCAPLRHVYAEEPRDDRGQPVVQGPAGGAGGANQPIVGTSVGSMNANVPSVALTATQMTGLFVVPTMAGPGTYTPMPSATPLNFSTPTSRPTMTSSSTPAPQATQVVMGLGGNLPATGGGATNNENVRAFTPVPTQIDTSLRNPLNAGEIDDNAEWGVYMTYRRNFLASPANSSPVDDVDVTERQLIRVVNEAGNPILGAQVAIMLEEGTIIHKSCTYATGYTLFFPNILDETRDVDSFRVQVSKGDASTEATMARSDEVLQIELDVEQSAPKLDVLFLIDATGSMDDEIAQLTNNILFISEEIDKLPDAVDVRYSLVSYKDGSFATQVWDFTSDVDEFQTHLAQLFTAGGDGETLNDGLDKSLHAVGWRGDDTAKLIFLIGDEPPGVYENHPSYAISMLLANEAGIKVHPIASSGLDVQGEYIFRQIAQTTMGHFIFLTYENGVAGIAGSDRTDLNVGEPDTEDASGEYTVEQLDDIVLNLIREEIAAMSEQ